MQTWKKDAYLQKITFWKSLVFGVIALIKYFDGHFVQGRLGPPPPSWNIWQPNDYESPCILKEMHKCRPKYSGDKVAKSIFCQHFHQGDVSLITSSGGGGGYGRNFEIKTSSFLAKFHHFYSTYCYYFWPCWSYPPPPKVFFQGVQIFYAFFRNCQGIFADRNRTEIFDNLL